MGARSSTSIVLLIAVALGVSSSAASAEHCRLALVLAMDSSKSMSSADFKLAFHGTAASLRSDEVQWAILGRSSPVALTLSAH